MNNKLFLPEKVKVGLQKRDDTYTGQLGYVIGLDKKGVWRKEGSWEGWRHKDIKPIELDNTPREGFVLNKGVGGQNYYYWHGRRSEYVRVYDPLGFEFEIKVSNLLFILQHCDCSRGKGLEGNFVYAWNRDKLVLLPEACQEYQNCKDLYNLKKTNVAIKDLVRGGIYRTNKNEDVVYLGKFDYHDITIPRYSWSTPKKNEFAANHGRKHVCWAISKGRKHAGQFFALKSGQLSTCISETPIENYAELVDDFNKSYLSSQIVSFFAKEIKPPKVITHNVVWWGVEKDGTACEYTAKYQEGKITGVFVTKRIIKTDDGWYFKSTYERIWEYFSYYMPKNTPLTCPVDVQHTELHAVMADGTERKLNF